MIKFPEKEIETFIQSLDFSKIEGQLIPVITQDYLTNQVLILAFANDKAVRKSLETGQVHYYSRSRNEIWKKGETSGHVQIIKKIFTDCDMDSILYLVEQIGAACHKGYYTCFYNQYDRGEFKTQEKKIFNPEEVYKS